MQYRELGNTGMRASVIGLGAEHLDGKDYALVESTIHAAQAGGMNIMDIFMPGEEIRRHIGKAIAGSRDKWILQGHIGSCEDTQQYDITRNLDTCKRYFEALLTNLGTDYIDLGMLFFMDSEEAYQQIFDNGIVDYVRSLKKDGVIRAIGASAHNPEIATRLVEEDVVEMLLFSINPAFDMAPAGLDVLSTFDERFAGQDVLDIAPERARLYQLCAQKGVGITVMKTLGAGKLLSPDMTPFKRPLTASQCVHYVLSRPAVTSALVGCASPEEVRDILTYFDKTPGELDYSEIISGAKQDFTGHCVYCNHCRPCPSNIDIAAVNKYYDIAALDTANVPPSIRSHYDALDAHAGDCIACGSCETRCPFSVPVMKRMEEAAAVFGR